MFVSIVEIYYKRIAPDENILYKKRGLGMFVSPQAKDIIINKRKNLTLEQLVIDLVVEANRLGVKQEELIEMIRVNNVWGGK